MIYFGAGGENLHKEKHIFYKVIAYEIDAFGVQVWNDENLGTIDEVHEFVVKHINEHPMAEWRLIPMVAYV